jgi:hypothetical protein
MEVPFYGPFFSSTDTGTGRDTMSETGERWWANCTKFFELPLGGIRLDLERHPDVFITIPDLL